MRDWKFYVKIKHLLSKSDDQSIASTIGEEISKVLKEFLDNHSELLSEWAIEELDTIIMHFSTINTPEQWKELIEEAPLFYANFDPITELNSCLYELCNWCDDTNVWVK